MLMEFYKFEQRDGLFKLGALEHYRLERRRHDHIHQSMERNSHEVQPGQDAK